MIGYGVSDGEDDNDEDSSDGEDVDEDSSDGEERLVVDRTLWWVTQLIQKPPLLLVGMIDAAQAPYYRTRIPYLHCLQSQHLDMCLE